MDTRQVGILLSCDAWAWQSSPAANSLIVTLNQVGMETILSGDSSSQVAQAYAAIFEKSPLVTNSSCKVFEVLQTNSLLNLHAELTGWLLDGCFMINGNGK